MSNHTRGADPEVRELLRRLTAQRFTYEKTRRCHYKIFSPGGKLVTVLGSTAGDWRALRNTLSWLRKAGFKHPR